MTNNAVQQQIQQQRQAIARQRQEIERARLPTLTRRELQRQTLSQAQARKGQFQKTKRQATRQLTSQESGFEAQVARARPGLAKPKYLEPQYQKAKASIQKQIDRLSTSISSVESKIKEVKARPQTERTERHLDALHSDLQTYQAEKGGWSSGLAGSKADVVKKHLSGYTSSFAGFQGRRIYVQFQRAEAKKQFRAEATRHAQDIKIGMAELGFATTKKEFAKIYEDLPAVVQRHIISPSKVEFGGVGPVVGVGVGEKSFIQRMSEQRGTIGTGITPIDIDVEKHLTPQEVTEWRKGTYATITYPSAVIAEKVTAKIDPYIAKMGEVLSPISTSAREFLTQAEIREIQTPTVFADIQPDLGMVPGKFTAYLDPKILTQTELERMPFAGHEEIRKDVQQRIDIQASQIQQKYGQEIQTKYQQRLSEARTQEEYDKIVMEFSQEVQEKVKEELDPEIQEAEKYLKELGVKGRRMRAAYLAPAVFAESFLLGKGLVTGLGLISKISPLVGKGVSIATTGAFGITLAAGSQQIAQSFLDDPLAFALEVTPAVAGFVIGANPKIMKSLKTKTKKFIDFEKKLISDKRGLAQKLKTKQISKNRFDELSKELNKKGTATAKELKNAIKRANNKEVRTWVDNQKKIINADTTLSSAEKLLAKQKLAAIVLESKSGISILTEAGDINVNQLWIAMEKMKITPTAKPSPFVSIIEEPKIKELGIEKVELQPFFKEAVIKKVKEKVEVRDIFGLKQIPRVKEKEKVREVQWFKQLVLSKEALRQLEQQRQKLVQIPMLAQIPRLAPKLAQPQLFFQSPVTRLRPRLKPKIKPKPLIVLPFFKIPFKKPVKKMPQKKKIPTEKGYGIEIRRKKKWVRIHLPHAFATKEGAHAVGMEKTVGEAAASYRIVKSLKPVKRTRKRPSALHKVMFRPGKGKDTMVQKKLLRITSPGEIREISLKGAAARRGVSTWGIGKPKKKVTKKKKKGGKK